MNGITITSIATLLSLCLVAYGPFRTGGGQGENDSAGGLNAAQGYNRLATDALDDKQSVKDVRQHIVEVKQQVAKRRGKGARRSMIDMQQGVKQQSEDRELQVIETRVDYGANGCVPSRCEGRELQVVETPNVKRLRIDVMQPTEDIEVVSEPVYVEVKQFSARPMDVEYVKDSSARTPARVVYLAAPERQECPTPQGVRVKLRVR